VTRRRQQRDTVPEPFVPMHELAAAWHRELNSASEGALWAPSSVDRGDSIGHLSPTTASAETVSGHRVNG
jgi:hypothetical protein